MTAISRGRSSRSARPTIGAGPILPPWNHQFADGALVVADRSGRGALVGARKPPRRLDVEQRVEAGRFDTVRGGQVVNEAGRVCGRRDDRPGGAVGARRELLGEIDRGPSAPWAWPVADAPVGRFLRREERRAEAERAEDPLVEDLGVRLAVGRFDDAAEIVVAAVAVAVAGARITDPRQRRVVARDATRVGEELADRAPRRSPPQAADSVRGRRATARRPRRARGSGRRVDLRDARERVEQVRVIGRSGVDVPAPAVHSDPSARITAACAPDAPESARAPSSARDRLAARLGRSTGPRSGSRPDWRRLLGMTSPRRWSMVSATCRAMVSSTRHRRRAAPSTGPSPPIGRSGAEACAFGERRVGPSSGSRIGGRYIATRYNSTRVTRQVPLSVNPDLDGMI